MELRVLGVLASVVEQWLDQKALDEGNMYTTSVFYRQIYPSLLHHRQFPTPAGVSRGRSGRPGQHRPEIEA
jgi:hypothetical protein